MKTKNKLLLEVQNLSISFGGLKAVDEVTFKVHEGEIVSIIGPNGAGKTTIFNLLTGIYKSDSGKVVFDGEEIQNRTPQEIVKAGIARTFQNIRLFKEMRVIENVLTGMHINTDYNFVDLLFRTKKFRTIEKEKTLKAIEILDSIGLADKISDYPSNLPYGDQRRLEIARAIATDAKIIILDEPAAGMNPQESEELLQFIKTLVQKGYTILLIEHDMSVVMNVSDRIYVIDHGRKVAEGLPEEIANNKLVIEAYLGKEVEDCA
ncbi:ABC transporter ATP-binding protein [Fusibacter ferrireducens]|uniref:ABC transporter ATP-binding protein n=1 Tax=Fusibacter ferrireducens TaxID=2785058 RepID=A0ABR9ZRP7_9FIRM|nr:ABC transporter ATP-binding protein [Fusibacter ferrireducens]MBF4693133.1 ABC transporter ATP-binding protein [Fusibacter ferrireducens]